MSYTRKASATVPGTNTLVSVNNTGDGQGGNGYSPITTASGVKTNPISANGRYVAFTSTASNLVAGDTNGKQDVFVRDLVNGTTTRVDVSSSGVQANGQVSIWDTQPVAISGTGRYVVFTSLATNLIDGQTISHGQVYMHDMVTGTTKVVTKLSDGTLSPKDVPEVDGVSDDGRFVVWKSNLLTGFSNTETNVYSEFVYLTDLQTQTTTVLNHTPATGQYFVKGTSMSCDGSLIAFSTSLQLISGDTGGIYIVDQRNGTTLSGILTTSSNGYSSLFPSISCNGNYVTFYSSDTSLITTGPVPSDGNPHQYLYDRINGIVSLADTSSSGAIANAGIYVKGSADNNGNTVFVSAASNLIDGHTISHTQVYLKHRDTGETELLSRTPGGSGWSGSNGAGDNMSISADGKTATYAVGTAATTLLSSDTNGYNDVIASSTGL